MISVPDISGNDPVFDESETRRILKFFCPHLAQDIDGMSIDKEARRLAQSMLIAAIDRSYAMGFVKATFSALTRPGSGIKSFGKNACAPARQSLVETTTRNGTIS